MLKTIVFVTCAASAAASPALRSNLLETANGELALGSAAAGAAKGDPQCAGRSKERLAPTEEGVAASALWCLCNTEEQVIKKLENCENKGGDKAKHCMFDAATETCVPRGGAAAAAAATTTAAPTEAAGGGANSVPEPGCSKKGLMPCGTGLFGLPDDIEMMTHKNNLTTELQKHALHSASKLTNVPLSDLTCFMCEGTGTRWVAVKNTYGEEAGQEAKTNGELWRSISLERNKERQRRLRKKQLLGAAADAAGKHSDPNAPLREFSFFQGQDTSEATDVEQGRVRSTYVVPVGGRRLQHNLRQLSAGSSNGSTNESTGGIELEIQGEEAAVAPSGITQCWVCRGSGKASSTLPSAMERAIIAGDEQEAAAGEEEKGDAKQEEEIELCLICWCDPAEFGISTSCTHLFCRECITGHLTQIQKSGEFPGFCPCCQASAPPGEEPRYGRITGPAMTFLQRKGLFDREFQFRFMKKQDEHEELFFACPSKCGH
jgi:hypothetical protein